MGQGDNQQKLIKELQAKVAALEAQVATLKTQLAQAQALASQVPGLQAQIDELNAEIARVKAQRDEYERLLAECEDGHEPSPDPCVYGEWTPTSEWSECINGVQSRTEKRVLVSGGEQCAAEEVRTVTQACVPPIPPTNELAVAQNMRTGRMYGYTETGDYRHIQQAMVDAQDGDVIQISPGAIFAPNTGDGSSYLENGMLHVWKSVTLMGIPGLGRWRLAPSDVPYVDLWTGLVIREPFQTYSDSGDHTRGNSNKTIVIQDFDPSNWGRGSADLGIKVRANNSPASWADYHASVTLRNFKLGKKPFYQSASGIAGSAENWIIEDGHSYDTGGGIGSAHGNDHNLYISGRNLTMRRMKVERTRSNEYPFNPQNTMDGHILKLTFNNATIEDCELPCGPEGDNSITIQMKGGGNLVVRRNRIIGGVHSQTATGLIVYEKEQNNYGGWMYGLEGHSLLIEDNDFVNHRPYAPAANDAKGMVYFRPDGHPQQVDPATITSVVIRNNRGMSTVPPEFWIKNAPPQFAQAWSDHNTVLPYGESPQPPTGDFPAWREAMTATDTLYNVSSGPPEDANPKIVWPNGLRPYGFGDSNAGWDVMSGYSSGVLIEALGEFGTMVYGTGGHTRLQNQLLSLNISDDAPEFDWFQQPYFEVSEANGAELYFNQAEFAALPANRKTGDGDGTEEQMTQAWLAAGAQFPMGYCGWMFPRKLVTGQLGKNNPHGFRYCAPCYVPPSVTGGSGEYLVVEAPQGPFSLSWAPSGAANSDMLDASAMWPSGRRKWPIWIKDVATGVWAKLAAPQPDYPAYGFVRQHTVCVPDMKRVYVSVDVAGGTAAWWYIDFSNGIAGATVSDLVQPSQSANPVRMNDGALMVKNGRHLWYWLEINDPSMLIFQDLDTGLQHRFTLNTPITPSGANASGNTSLQYDAAHHRLLLLCRDPAPKCLSISIPQDDPLNAAGYVVTEKTIAIDASVAQPLGLTGFYSKARFHQQLGVMFVPQDHGPMLAFRPS